MNITKVTKLAENPNGIPVPVPKEEVRAETKVPNLEGDSGNEEARMPNLLGFDSDSMLRGIIMATILGPPKGKMARRRM
jgi:hypothetical protein